MIRRINLYGGPGAGKSTTAAELFAKLKRMGVNIELVTEYVKSWAVLNRVVQPLDQILLLGKQTNYEHRFLSHGTDHTVTDSPVFLGACYADFYAGEVGLGPHIASIHAIYEKEYPSLNIYLDRGDKPYDPQGRYQSYEDALALDKFIRRRLEEEKISFKVMKFDEPDAILELVLDKINGG